MKKLLSFVFMALLLVSCGTTNTTTTTTTEPAVVKKDVTDFANSITSEELKEKLYVYASDEFEGRETGTPGQKKAIEFIKKRYVDLGIPSAYGGDNYYQPVPLEKQGQPEVALKIGGTDFKYGEDLVAFGGTDTMINAEDIVYVGYGIQDEKYNSYEGIDVTGKIVLFKSGEPKNADGNYTISGTDEASKWSKMRQEYRAKPELAKKNGAVAAFYSYPEFYKMMAPRMMRGGGLSLKSKETKDEEKGMNLYLINTSVADALVNDMATNHKSATVKLPVSISHKKNTEQVNSENVVAVIKGSEKPDEYVVISSHLDHIGISRDGQINNGADDDGSGTVSTIEIAEAFKMAADNGQGPKRSVVFLHVTGEEKGLLGSKYYTDMDPIYPLANTVANLNIDMIGRTDPKRKGDPNYVYLIGSDRLSTELHNLSEETNKKYTNMVLDYTYNAADDPNNFYGRSDHFNFAKNNIPIIFYFNGTHADYHRPSDTPDKIEYDLMSNRAKLIFHTAWELANRAERITVDKAGE